MSISKTKIFFTAVLFLLMACKRQQPKKPELVEENSKNEWTPIFNGKDLSGWTMKINGYPLAENFGNTFRVEEGILSIRYDEYGPELGERFGALFFDKKLSNYRLKVE